jgi:SAM-dependent methyltransferase
MRYEIVADSPSEENVLKTHPATRSLFDPFLPALQARSLMAAVRLGIFEAMDHHTRTVEEIAAACDLDAEALGLLLRVLTCAGYVSGTGASYCLTDLARTCFLKDSPMRLSAWVEFNYVHWDVMSRLEEVLQSGQGIDAHQCLATEAEWATYQEAMLETARPAAPWLATQVPVPPQAQRLLDIGGSHGLYGAMICREHPPLRSVVLDLADAVPHARKLAQKEGIDDVVTHRAGNVLTEDLGEQSCDVVFLGNIVHHFTSAENQDLLQRIKAALRPGGSVAIWDFKLPDTGAKADLVSEGLALLFRIGSQTRAYTIDEYRGWLAAEKFQDLRIHATPAPAQVLLTGRVV